MIGARSAFSELDSEIHGTVKFGDGSIVKIEGRDTILFIGKGGEHRKLNDVYFIPRFKANLVSLGQLNEAGCYIYIKRGLLKICNNRRQLLMQVRRTTNRLYILKLKIKQPVSLSARTEKATWSFPALQKLHKEEMVYGLPAIIGMNRLYDGCLIGKQKRTSFPSQASYLRHHSAR